MEIIEQLHGESINEGHLGGFSQYGDGGTYYPIMWKYLVDTYEIKSVLDIGCGRGYSAKFFESIGCQIRGIEGSNTGIHMSIIPNNVIQHDYNTGFSPIKILSDIQQYDLGWCCEFVEHVESQYMLNYLEDFMKCKYIAMTFATPGQGGHHHVNENTQDYWINVLKLVGFEFLEQDTYKLRAKTIEDKLERYKIPNCPSFIPHFVERGLFFKNIK